MAVRDSSGRFVKGSGGGGVKIRDVDRGAKAMLERIAGATLTNVTVGVHEAEGGEAHDEADGLTILDVATMHEFGGTDEDGNESPPRRSFIGDWADEAEQENKSDLRKISQAVIKGKVPSLEQGLERFGVLAVAKVQARIRSGIAPELADSTKAQKGSSTPLISGGQLLGSITHVVKKG